MASQFVVDGIPASLVGKKSNCRSITTMFVVTKFKPCLLQTVPTTPVETKFLQALSERPTIVNLVLRTVSRTTSRTKSRTTSRTN